MGNWEEGREGREVREMFAVDVYFISLYVGAPCCFGVSLVCG